jgi:hypothetical protein
VSVSFAITLDKSHEVPDAPCSLKVHQLNSAGRTRTVGKSATVVMASDDVMSRHQATGPVSLDTRPTTADDLSRCCQGQRQEREEQKRESVESVHRQCDNQKVAH